MEMSFEILLPVLLLAAVVFFALRNSKKSASDKEFTPDNPNGGVKSDSQSKITQK